MYKLVIMITNAFTSTYLGAMIAALAPDLEIALAMFPITYVVFILFCG